MAQRRLRQKTRISYHELEEPSFDEYVYCDKCGDYVYEYCSIHGPLLVIPDDKVPPISSVPSDIPLAALTIPHVFLHLAPSTIPGAGLGVHATLTLPQGVRFGPYRGRLTQEVNSAYCWQIYDSSNKPLHAIDGIDVTNSNWMRYVNCARHCLEQNLIAFQYQGEIYYRTMKMIPRCTELLVFYGSEYAGALRVDLQTYNSKQHYLAAGGHGRSSINQMNKTEAGRSKKVDEEVTTTLEISSVEYKNEIQDGHGVIEDDFRYLDDASIITEGSQKTEETQLKVELNSEKNCFNITFYNNDIHEFRDNAELANQIMQVDCNFDNSQQFNAEQIDSERQIHKIISGHDNLMQAELTSVGCPLIATNNQLHTADLNTNQLVHNSPNSTGTNFDNKLTHSCKNMFTKLITDRESWQCKNCHKILTSKFSLNSHAKIHQDKKFHCPECNYKTNFKYRLKKHMPFHTGIYEFVCDICSFSTNSQSNLNNHKRRMHGNECFNCMQCTYKAPSKLTMDYHRNLHGRENVRKCVFCDYLTDKNRYMYRHVQAVHANLKKVLALRQSN